MMSKSIKMSGKEKKGRWRRSIESNGITKEISVREADNDGYIINLTVYGDFPTVEGETEYKHKEKEFISKVNPLGDEDDSFKQKLDALEDAVTDNLEF